MSETIAARMRAARKALVTADIDGSALDARLLMQTAAGLSHEQLVSSTDTELSAEANQRFTEFLNRRLAHEPVSRILGTREFYGREFLVTPAVLDPRADTEALIDLVLELSRPEHGRLIDIGTGSGAIAVSLLAEMPNFSGIAVDLSADALHVAKSNALANGVSGRLQFHHGSWFEGIAEKFELIVSNPPYIPHGVIAGLSAEVREYDPHLALDGGADGLFAYRALAGGARLRLAKDGMIAVEIGAGQGPDVTAIFVTHGFEAVGQRYDLGGHLRALTFR